MKSFFQKIVEGKLSNHEKGLIAAITLGVIITSTCIGTIYGIHALIDLGIMTLFFASTSMLCKFMYDAFQDK